MEPSPSLLLSKSTLIQIRGQHISLFPKGHPIHEGHLKPFTSDEAERLRTAIEEAAREEKYVRIAELAGIK